MPLLTAFRHQVMDGEFPSAQPGQKLRLIGPEGQRKVLNLQNVLIQDVYTQMRDDIHISL